MLSGNLTFRSLLLVCLVHRLKPADIKVIGAMGDSLTVSYLRGGRKGWETRWR